MFKKHNKVQPPATYREVWSKGDVSFKLSFLLMGFVQLRHKQWAKGIALLGIQIAFWVWFIVSGVGALSMLSNLCEINSKKVVFDQAQGV